jgi:methionyl-tRNA formyltransferase
MRPLRTIALLARDPGLLVLRDALLGNPMVDLLGVYTHGKLTKAEGGGRRPELDGFIELCRNAGVPLDVMEMSGAGKLAEEIPARRPDILMVLSWRTILTAPVLAAAPRGALNIHRGALPAYPGMYPVQRAIENGDRRVAITALRMVEELDAGPVVATVWHDIDPLKPGRSSADYAEEIKLRLLPLYAPLARLAIATATI